MELYYDPYDYMDTNGIYSFAFSMIILLAIVVFLLACIWKIFVKAHEEGWAAIVPVYNTYIFYKITWGNGWFFLLMLIPFVNFFIFIITMIKLAQAFGKGGGFACGLLFLPMIFFPILALNKNIKYVGVPGKQMDYGPGAAGTWQDPYQQHTNYQQNTYTQTSSQNSDYHYQRTEPSGGFTGKYCPHCGKELEPGSKFCASCGNRL